MSEEDKTVIKNPASVGGGGNPTLREPTIVNAGQSSRDGSEESFSQQTPKPKILLTDLVRVQLDNHTSVLAEQFQSITSRMEQQELQRQEDSVLIRELIEQLQMQNSRSQVAAPRLSQMATPPGRRSNREDFDPAEDIQDEEFEECDQGYVEQDSLGKTIDMSQLLSMGRHSESPIVFASGFDAAPRGPRSSIPQGSPFAPRGQVRFQEGSHGSGIPQERPRGPYQRTPGKVDGNHVRDSLPGLMPHLQVHNQPLASQPAMGGVQMLQIQSQLDFAGLGLMLSSSYAKAVFKWMKKFIEVQNLYPSTHIPLWSLLSEDVKIRVADNYQNRHLTQLSPASQSRMSLDSLLTLLRDDFRPTTQVTFVVLLKDLVGDEHLRALPSDYKVSLQNFSPLQRSVGVLRNNFLKALALILGDQAAVPIDASILPALDDKKNPPGFFRLWNDQVPHSMGEYIFQTEIIRMENLPSRVTSVEDYIDLWFLCFNKMYKQSQIVQSTNLAFKQTSEDAKYSKKGLFVPPPGKPFVPRSSPGAPAPYKKSLHAVSGFEDEDDFWQDEQASSIEGGRDSLGQYTLNYHSSENVDLDESDFRNVNAQDGLSATYPPSSRPSGPSAAQRPGDQRTPPPGTAPCFPFARTGRCDKRDQNQCVFSHDRGQAAQAWRSMADQHYASPFADQAYRPKPPTPSPRVLQDRLNFVAQTPEEEAQKRIDDSTNQSLNEVRARFDSDRLRQYAASVGYPSARLSAPPLDPDVTLTPRGPHGYTSVYPRGN